MTTKRIVYTRPDGGVSVACPAPRRIDDLLAGGATEAEALAVIQAKSVPSDAVDVEIVELATIPTDRWFRNAWTRPIGGGSIEVDMPKAREIQAQKIQAARRKAIGRLQSEEDKARLVGKSAGANQHAADRAALETMNLTAIAASIAGAANPTALKAIWPSGLLQQAV